MDSQAIGPTAGLTAAQQPQTRAQSTAVAKRGDPTVDARHADDTKPEAKDDLRPRDPRSLQYQVDRGTQQVVATIVDDSNRTVIRQIPDEEILRIAKAIDRMQGFLLESKA